jgi:hypothetical protein
MALCAPTRVEVDALALRDLLERVDDLLARVVEDREVGVAWLQGAPLALVDALRGAAAEVRVHTIPSP